MVNRCSLLILSNCELNSVKRRGKEDEKIKVLMDGGYLDVEIRKDGHILIIGDAKEVYEGKINLKSYE